MKVFLIGLPASQDFGSQTLSARLAWEDEAITRIGNYAKLPMGHGHLSDEDEEVKIPLKSTQVYQLICEQDDFVALLNRAFDLFPAETHLFTAGIGHATLVERPVVAPSQPKEKK